MKLLRAHIKRYGTARDGRIFRTARGGILQDSAYGEVWTEARKEALTPAQCRSPLGRRPYDLRHAAVSLWLNSGVPATEVARRARARRRGPAEDLRALHRRAPRSWTKPGAHGRIADSRGPESHLGTHMCTHGGLSCQEAVLH